MAIIYLWAKFKSISLWWMWLRSGKNILFLFINLLPITKSISKIGNEKMMNKGFNLVTIGSDSRYIAEGAKTDLEKLKGIKGSKSKGY